MWHIWQAYGHYSQIRSAKFTYHIDPYFQYWDYHSFPSRNSYIQIIVCFTFVDLYRVLMFLRRRLGWSIWRSRVRDKKVPGFRCVKSSLLVWTQMWSYLELRCRHGADIRDDHSTLQNAAHMGIRLGAIVKWKMVYYAMPTMIYSLHPLLPPLAPLPSLTPVRNSHNASHSCKGSELKPHGRTATAAAASPVLPAPSLTSITTLNVVEVKRAALWNQVSTKPF